MTPDRALEMLDRVLDTYGDDVDLVRVTGTTHQVRFTATVRGYAMGYLPRELGDQIIQGDTKLIISPTDIGLAQWPGGQVDPIGDTQVPRKGDKVIIQERERNVQSSTPFYINGQLVRIELQLRGQ